MPGKIGIRIPSHNSLTPSFLDELIRTAATSRKIIDAHKIRRRFPEKPHIAIVSTGLSYLAYLGALKKVRRGYKTTRTGKKIGKLIAQEDMEEANVLWGELLKRHRLHKVFQRYFAKNDGKQGTIEDFGVYLRNRAHAKWNIPTIRSRISRLCELFADKGLIEYQNGDLSPISNEEETLNTSEFSSSTNRTQVHDTLASTQKSGQASISSNSWPIRMEINFVISKGIDPKILEMILSFLKDMKGTLEVSEN